MTRSVILRPAARRDIHQHADYIGRRRRAAGRRFYDAVVQTLDRLLASPEIAGPCEFSNARLAGLRVWPVRGYKNYLIFYLPDEAGITVVRVLHGARDIERILAEEG